jgi:GT2 family glycosyltransferase
MNKNLSFSIIINSYGRDSSSISKTLIQAKKSNPFEIILIDQNTNNLQITVDDVKYFHFPEKAISQARNFAANNAQGNWLVFLDDDALLDENSIKSLNTYLSVNQDQVIGGKIMVSENSTEYYSKRQKLSSGPISFLNLKAVMGGLFAVEKETFIQIKGFDPHFGIGGKFPSSEDTDFVWKAYFDKKKIGFCSDFYALHPRSSNISNEKALQYGIGKGAMVAKWIKTKKKYLCLFEFFEMLIVPLLKGNLSSLRGRIIGWRDYVE